MNFIVNCPRCRQNVKTDEGFNGREITCPHCQQRFLQTTSQPQFQQQPQQQYGNMPQNNNSSNGAGCFFTWLGYGCYIFGVIDFCGMFFNYDLTGVFWSPIAASILGTLFLNIAKKYDPSADKCDENAQ